MNLKEKEKMNTIQFTLNTHHAYLNNYIVIKSSIPQLTVTDDDSGTIWTINGEIKVRLGAGVHHLRSECQEEIVIIEDALKFGGSEIKKGIIFDNNPWVFVIAMDRLYITNRNTEEEKVEYNITPETIECTDDTDSSIFFLFKTKNDYSIYNVESGEVVFSFNGYIYCNEHLVIYKKEGTVCVYNYISQKTIVHFTGQYSIYGNFYFVNENHVYCLNLTTDTIEEVEEIGCLCDNDYMLCNNLFVKGNSKQDKYTLFHLNGDKSISKTTVFRTPYIIKEWCGVKNARYSEVKEGVLQMYNKNIFDDYNITKPSIIGINIHKTNNINANEEHSFTLYGEMNISCPSRIFYNSINTCGTHKFVLYENENGVLSFDDSVFNDSIFDNETQEKNDIEKTQEKKLFLNQYEKVIGQSKNGLFFITIESGELYIRMSDDNKNVETLNYSDFSLNIIRNDEQDRINILSDIIDNTKYNNAFFTSDGKKVVLQIDSHTQNIIGFDDLELTEFDISNCTVGNNSGINGYKPELVFNTSNRNPIWRDPITLQIVEPEKLSNYIFMSPDKKYCAYNNMQIIHINRLENNEIISNLDYNSLVKKYNYNENTKDEEKLRIIEFRKSLIKHHTENPIFKELSAEQIEKRTNFTAYFIDTNYYVKYKSTETDKDEKIIPIDKNALFLNYVSFSYDSKYLAFGAKISGGTGVFVIYDIIEGKEILRKTRNENNVLMAIWMTTFNKNGDVAYYDSTPNSYIVTAESNYKEIKNIKGKNLLCFSPSGKYIAFSDQKYIDYTHHPNCNWGHQPSGNIFIYDTNNLDLCLEQYNDFGTGISGLSTRAGNVASVAFSQDEKHLLAVGTDGVVVVRNLHNTDK